MSFSTPHSSHIKPLALHNYKYNVSHQQVYTLKYNILRILQKKTILNINQGIIDLNRHGNSATLFSNDCNAKFFLKSGFILLKIE